MENNRTDRQPRTVDFSLFDQIEKAVPAYDLDKAIQKRDYRIDLTQHYADAEYLLTVDGIGMLAKGDIQERQGEARQNIFHHGIGRGRTERKVRGVKGLRRGLSCSDRGHGAEHEKRGKERSENTPLVRVAGK